MAINKVEYNGEVLMDLTNDTVTEDTLASGVTAHNAAGVQITGTFEEKKEVIYIPIAVEFNEQGEIISVSLVNHTYSDIVGYIQDEKMPILTWTSELFSLNPLTFSFVAQGGSGLLFQTFFDSMSGELQYLSQGYCIWVYENSVELQIVKNITEDNVVDETVEDITKGWTNYLPTVGATQQLISIATNKIVRPFKVTASLTEENKIANVRANGQSSDEVDIYSLISSAHSSDNHIYLELTTADSVETILMQLASFNVSRAIFSTVKEDETEVTFFGGLNVIIQPGNVFSFTYAFLVDDTTIQYELNKIEEIANGKCTTYVKTFRNKTDPNYVEGTDDSEVLETWLTQVDTTQFKVGDIFLIKDIGVPDYWWNGEGISVLETTKVSLNEYYTQIEVDSKLADLTTSFDTKLTKKQNIQNIQLQDYADVTRYYKLGSMVIDNSGNYGNFTFTGRLGGWTNANAATYSIMLMNRGAYDGNTITSAVSAMGPYESAIGAVDIVVAKNEDLSHTVYLKAYGYFCCDFDWTAYQHSIVYDGSYITTEPGNIVWQLSNAPKTILSSDGTFSATGGIIANDSAAVNGYSISVVNEGDEGSTGTVGKITFVVEG